MDHKEFADEHISLARRYFLQLGLCGVALTPTAVLALAGDNVTATPPKKQKPDKAGARREPYLTPQDEFRDVSRGKPLPHSLLEEKKRSVGLTRETWKLEILSDPDHPASVGKQLSKADGTALDFDALLKLGEKHSIRFLKVMTCLNLGCPLGMGLWEGVPLREVIWLTQPKENIRRVHYHGYHNDDPKQIFRSSLPIGRVLEDPFDLPPVILCYKLNGEWLDSERGGPVRMVVPEAYGFKSIKWLSHVVLTNLAHANDTYAEQNNDVDSMLKTYAATLSIPKEVKAGEPIPISGYAQVGASGLARVEVSLESKTLVRSESDPHFTQCSWSDAQMLAAPQRWDGLVDEKLPAITHGIDGNGKPKSWPMRFTNAHWAVVLPGVGPGEYTFRCRTIDEKGNAQPLPRPFRKGGHAAIESIAVTVKDA
jgi:DMSO/TMAO reductase YedYZ molybdopterin-dependent catalytic subunit